MITRVIVLFTANPNILHAEKAMNPTAIGFINVSALRDLLLASKYFNRNDKEPISTQAGVIHIKSVSIASGNRPRL